MHDIACIYVVCQICIMQLKFPLKGNVFVLISTHLSYRFAVSMIRQKEIIWYREEQEDLKLFKS